MGVLMLNLIMWIAGRYTKKEAEAEARVEPSRISAARVSLLGRVSGDPAAGQSRWWSIYETLANVVTGFLMGVTINVLVLPLFGYPVSFVHALDITAIFTVATTVRSYTLRRIFNMINRSKA